MKKYYFLLLILLIPLGCAAQQDQPVRITGDLHLPDIDNVSQDDVLYRNPTTGEITYYDAPSGGGHDTGDSISELWAAVFEDTVAMREDLWSWAFTDSAQLESGKKLAIWYYPGPDSMHVDTAIAISLSASPNFTYNYHWANDISGSDTDGFSSARQVTGSDATSTGEKDVPNNKDIPPYVWIWMTISDRTTIPADGAGFTFIGTYF